MAKYNAVKIEECEAWVAAHGLIDYGGAKLKEFVREMGIDEKTYRLWMNCLLYTSPSPRDRG